MCKDCGYLVTDENGNTIQGHRHCQECFLAKGVLQKKVLDQQAAQQKRMREENESQAKANKKQKQQDSKAENAAFFEQVQSLAVMEKGTRNKTACFAF